MIMKARVPWQPSNKQRKVMKAEINKQILMANAQYDEDIDAVVLFTLHSHLGFGKKRLRRFWEALQQNRDDMVKHYQMPDYPFICHKVLEEIGVNIKEWSKEIE